MSVDPTLVWVDRSDRERLVITGPDRAKFLNNLCTNDVKRLSVGQGCEAFVTSPQGRTLGLVTILAREESLLLLADPGGLQHILPHFEKYAVFDDVAFSDKRESTFEIHMNSALPSPWFVAHGLPLPGERELDHVSASWVGASVEIVRESPLALPQQGYTIIGPAETIGSENTKDRLVAALGVAPLSSEDFEGLRIAAGTPRFGRDFTVDNLPQEVGRDARAISFVKGCYLGQETVARLDALGHVNKILRGMDVQEGQPPESGTPLTVGGQPAGVVTSSGRSPWDGRGVALAMVRVKAAPVGSIVSWDGGHGVIVDRQAR